MQKPISKMTDAEKQEYLEQRHVLRKISPLRKPSRKTIKSLANAWGIADTKIIEAILLYSKRGTK
jgi:hypothetical protein